MSNNKDRKLISFTSNSRFIDAQGNVGQRPPDNLRRAIGDLWLFFYYNASGFIKVRESENPNLPESVKPSIQSYELVDTGDPMVHRIIIDTDNNPSLYSEDDQMLFRQMMLNVVDRDYDDINYIVNLMEDGSNQEEQELGILNLYATAKSNYNFYHQKYESTILQDQLPVSELDMPNFYFFTLFDQTTLEARRALTLNNRMSYNPDARLENGATPRSGNLSPIQKYFTDWSNLWMSYASEDTILRPVMQEVMKRIDFSQQDVRNLSEVYKSKESFPMFNAIEFTTEADSEFGDTLEKTNFSTKLQNFIRHAPPYRNNFYTVQINDTIDGGSTRDYTKMERLDLWAYDDFVEMMDDDNSEVMESIYGFSSGTEETRAYRTLMSMIVKGKVNRLKRKYERNYRDLHDGKLAYSEPFSYLVTKRKQGELTPEQYFHFANTEKSDVIKFIDTQVRYGDSYTYDIHSINLTFATRYRYFNFQEMITQEAEIFRSFTSGQEATLTPPKKRYTIDITCEPRIFITKDKVYSKTIRMMDSPPLPPEATFIPYKGVSDKVSIYLNSSIGRAHLEPIIMEPREQEAVDHFRESQETDPEDKTILFESDDAPEYFQMFRIEHHPYSYEDFIDGKMILLETGDNRINATLHQKQRGTTASYCDSIKPNKKYYYCFRELDVHAHLSNPSPVYCVEMYDDNGSIYPKIDVVEFKKPKHQRESVSFRRFLSLSPSPHNIYVNEADSQMPEDGPLLDQEIKLGLPDSKVWGKKFKIRLTSKSTGRKLDFNFSYTQRTKNVPREES